MSANSQYIPLKNEYILHSRLNIYCIRLRIYLHRQTQYYCVCNSNGLANCGHLLNRKVSLYRVLVPDFFIPQTLNVLSVFPRKTVPLHANINSFIKRYGKGKFD